MWTGAKARKVRMNEKETAILRFLLVPAICRLSRATCCRNKYGATFGASPPTPWKPTSMVPPQKIEKDAATPPDILVTEAEWLQAVAVIRLGKRFFSLPRNRFFHSIEDDVAIS